MPEKRLGYNADAFAEISKARTTNSSRIEGGDRETAQTTTALIYADVEDQEVDYSHKVHLVAPSRLQSHPLRLENEVQIHDQGRSFQILAYREITSEPKECWQHGIMEEEVMIVGRERPSYSKDRTGVALVRIHELVR